MKIDDLKDRLDSLWAMLEEEGFYTKANTVVSAKNIIEELEAQLAKAVEALQQLVIEYDEVDLAYDEPKSMTAAYVVALDTLAELTGGKDE